MDCNMDTVGEVSNSKNAENMYRVTFQTSKYRTRIYQNVSRFNLFPIITHLKITSSCKVIKLTLSVGKVRFSTRMISPQLDWKLRFKFSQGLSLECKSRWLCETLSIASSLDCLFNFYIFKHQEICKTYYLRPAYTENKGIHEITLQLL